MARHDDSSQRPPAAYRGQSLVELALLLPLLTLIVVGTIDLGRVFIYYTRLTNAVREGALYGSHQPYPLTPIRDRAYAEVGGSLGVTGVDFVVDPTAGDIVCYSGLSEQTKPCNRVVHGDSIRVTGHYAFKPITTSIVSIWGRTFWVSKSSRMSINSGFECNDGNNDGIDRTGGGICNN